MSQVLTKRAAYTGSAVPPGWEVTASWPHGRAVITPGTVLKIRGERGTFRFVRHVRVTPADRRRSPREWIDVIGGTPGVSMYRAFRPDRVAKILKNAR